MNDSIFSPQFNITPIITSTLEDIERQKWLIDNMLMMPKHEAWMRREIRVERAVGTTRIEGAKLDEAAVRELAKSRGTGKLSEDEQANVNALQAYEFIDFLSDQQDIPIDELVIRQLNRYFINGAPETLTPGVYRKGQNTVGKFSPPDQGDVPSLMRSFTLWLRKEDSEIHPVIKAGIAHIHMVAIHPFWDGNGRTARGLSTLILQRSQFDLKKILSIESYLFAIRDRYFTAIERTLGTRFLPEYDATSWLEFFVMAFLAQVEDFTAQLTDWHRAMEGIHNLWVEIGLTTRQRDALMFVIRAGQITRSDYIEITGVSPVTASRDLAQLVELGLLTAEGKTRSRIYRPVAPESESSSEEQSPLLEET